MTERPEQSTAPPSKVAYARAVASSSASVRWAAGGILAVCVALLGTAAALTPDARGFGTHEQLGTGPCGMVVMTGYPCPTCGMTTAFAYAVRGRLLRAFWAQPAGLAMALGAVGVALLCCCALARGRWPRARWRYLAPHHVFLAVIVLMLGGWAFKIWAGRLAGTLPYGS